MPSAQPVADLLADLRRGLSALGVRWFLFGAQAAVLHGATTGGDLLTRHLHAKETSMLGPWSRIALWTTPPLHLAY